MERDALSLVARTTHNEIPGRDFMLSAQTRQIVQAFYAKKGVNLKQIATKTISAVLTS